MASLFSAALAQLLPVLGVLVGVVFLGDGIALPPAQASILPPTHCIAGIWYYQQVFFLQLVCAFLLIAAALCVVDVKYNVDGAGGLEFILGVERLKLRLILLLALICTMSTIILAAVNYLFVLQVKYTIWRCLPAGVKGSVIGVVGVVVFITAGFHYRLAVVALYHV